MLKANSPLPVPTNATSFTNGHPRLNQNARQSPLQMLSELQRLMMEDARQTKIKPIARAIVARAIKEIESLKREIKMQPKPKPVDVSLPVRSKRSKSWVEPAEASLNPRSTSLGASTTPKEIAPTATPLAAAAAEHGDQPPDQPPRRSDTEPQEPKTPDAG